MARDEAKISSPTRLIRHHERCWFYIALHYATATFLCSTDCSVHGYQHFNLARRSRSFEHTHRLWEYTLAN